MRITMLLYGSIRDDPRALKEARTLVDALGAQIVVVTNKSPGQTLSAERVGRGVVAVRTTTGWLRWLKTLFSRSRPSPAQPVGKAPVEVGRTLHRRRPPPSELLFVPRFSLVVKMAGLACRSRPDVIHCHNFSTLLAGYLAARLRGVPLVYDAHEVNLSRERYYRQLPRLVAMTERFLIHRCDAVITATLLRAKHFRRIYRLPKTPIVLQNRSVFSGFPEAVDLRKRFKVPASALLLLYQGSLQRGRGLHSLIDAVAAVPGVHCVLVGDGYQRQELQQEVAERELADRVHFHTRVPYAELPAITAGADLGVQLIRNIGFNHWSTDSNKLFDYVQAGLGVIASDLPEIRRIVRGCPIAALVAPGDSEAVANLLRQLQRDRAQVERLRSAAASAAAELSWTSEAPKLIQLYASLCGTPVVARWRGIS